MKKSTRSMMVTLLSLALLVLACLPVWAKPLLEISISASKEVVETVNGIRTVKRVPATTATIGDVLTYTLSYSNKGDEAATEAVVDNPISAETSYIDNSAVGAGANITFSIDKGKTYKKPALLTYEIKQPNGAVQKYTARPEEYTHIRWTIKQVPAGTGGTLGFSVKVK